MNTIGLILGIVSFCIIGIWHPTVVKSEYYFGKRACIGAFLAIGAICLAISLCSSSDYISLVLALFGFSAFWGIHEVCEQEKRVARGWFPKNPAKEQKMVKEDCVDGGVSE